MSISTNKSQRIRVSPTPIRTKISTNNLDDSKIVTPITDDLEPQMISIQIKNGKMLSPKYLSEKSRENKRSKKPSEGTTTIGKSVKVPKSTSKNLRGDSTESEGEYPRGKWFRRCCRKERVCSHNQEIRPKVKWPKPVHQEIKRDKQGNIIPTKKMKEMRRRQFYNFLNDFFEKARSGHFKNYQKELT